MARQMDERKRSILKAVTDDYIKTAEPVGSRTIARKYSLGISPATIRNEMADLEDEGYLEQPHTSAGRIPSDRGYRFYVDSLMAGSDLTGIEESLIRSEYENRRNEIQSIVKATAKILADLSSCASVVVAPAIGDSEIRHVQLGLLDSTSILILVVTSAGLVEHRVLALEHSITPAELDRISWIMNHRLRGLTVSQMRGRVLKELQAELSAYTRFIEGTLELLLAAVNASDEERVYTDGLVHFLGQPEFKEIDKAKPVLRFLESDDQVLNLLSSVAREGKVSVKIGSEIREEELRNCSIVTASYGAAGSTLGTISIVGPTRMDYAKAIALVGFMAEGISEFLSRVNSRGRQM